MPFIALNELPKMELFPGVRSALAAGSQLMLSALEMEHEGVVPEHSHPHEQAGLVLEGKLRLRIGDEERELAPGDAFIIPSHVVHSGVVTEDAFSTSSARCARTTSTATTASPAPAATPAGTMGERSSR